MIGRSGERGSGISVLAARHDDDDEMINELNEFVDDTITLHDDGDDDDETKLL